MVILKAQPIDYVFYSYYIAIKWEFQNIFFSMKLFFSFYLLKTVTPVTKEEVQQH